jgi:hypothetical protein
MKTVPIIALALALAVWGGLLATQKAASREAITSPVSVAAPVQSDDIERTYDRFEKQTVIKSKPRSIDGMTRWAVMSVCTGNKGCAPIGVSIIFVVDVLPIDPPRISLLADGKAVRFRNMTIAPYSEDRASTGSIQIPRLAFVRMLDARKIEGRVGKTEFTFSDGDVATLKAFWRAVTVGP